MKSFVVYKSSAGSGKTFTLVREYLAVVLLEPDKFRHILAVTFTNKAASEMKERVVRYLTALAEPPADKEEKTIGILRKQLLEVTNLDPDEMQRRASYVLKQLMHHYTEFAVGTIDSFMHRVVRAFAFDLGIPVNFEVEIESGELLSRAVDILISRAGTDEVLTNTLVSFVESKTEDEKSWDVERDLLKVSEHLFKEEARPYLNRLEKLSVDDLNSIRNSLIEFLTQYQKELTDLALEALNLIASAGLDADAFKQKKRGLYGYFVKIKDGRFDELQPNSYVLSMTADGEISNPKASPETVSKVDSLKDDLLSIYQKIQEIREEREGRYLVLEKVYQNVHQLALLSELSKIVDDFRKEDSIVHISEFNRRIYDFVIKEPVPFIYERLGEKFKHYLLDEFQDTSLQQWHNLLPLVENALSYANYNMVVGDGKQAIYRFRAGDVEQFTRLPGLLMADNEVLRQRERTLKENYEQRNLGINYRSEAEIVRFNNDLFSVVKEWLPADFRDIYDDIIQEEGKKEGGYVHIDFVDSKDEYHDIQLQKVMDSIRECTGDGYRWGDIAILCRENDKASLVARHLLSNGVDVISSESLLVGSAGSVMFVTAFLKVLFRPEDIISYITVAKILEERGPVEATDTLSLLSVFRKHRREKDRWLSVRKELMRILGSHDFSIDMGSLLSFSLFELVEEIARRFNMLDHRDPYLLAFMDIVREQIGKGRSDPDDFLSWWEENKASQSVVIPEGINAVRIMTIHKAKGLQFPVVIYPFADQIKKLTRKELWISLDDPGVKKLPVALVNANQQLARTAYAAQYEEEDAKSFIDLVNLLYVALTRPEQRLYIISRYYDKEGNSLNTVGKILRKWLIEKSLWSDEEKGYQFGETKRVTGQAKEPAGATISKMISEPWSDRFLLRMNAPYYWDVEDPEKNRRWGNLVHLVFSKIDHRDEAQAVIEELVAEGALSEAEIKNLKEEVDRVVDHPSVRPYFDNDYRVMNEAEVISSDGGLYRPDRLLVKDGKAIVIDFKTGRHREEYKEQLAEYAEVLRDMNYEVEEQVLIYIGKKVSLVAY